MVILFQLILPLIIVGSLITNHKTTYLILAPGRMFLRISLSLLISKRSVSPAHLSYGLIDNLTYTLNGNQLTRVDDVMRTAEGVVSLERVPTGEANKPFLVAQSVDYGLANGQKVDVRSSTGKIGPNSSFKTATLHTTMLLWGEDIANAQNYSLRLADEYGILPAAQSSSALNNSEEVGSKQKCWRFTPFGVKIS